MGLGMPEVVLILVIALIVFGPRKLPELGKSLGQAMAQFRRASDDFKRTWEQEVELEKIRTSESTTTATSYDYNTTNEPYDPYNSYTSEPETAQAADSTNTTAPNTAALDANKTEPAKAEAATAAAAPKSEKHWI